MTVGQLRALLLQLDSTDIPDNAPVLITTRYTLHTARAEVMPVHKLNALGQTDADPYERDGLKGLVFVDTSTG